MHGVFSTSPLKRCVFTSETPYKCNVSPYCNSNSRQGVQLSATVEQDLQIKRSLGS